MRQALRWIGLGFPTILIVVLLALSALPGAYVEVYALAALVVIQLVLLGLYYGLPALAHRVGQAVGEGAED